VQFFGPPCNYTLIVCYIVILNLYILYIIKFTVNKIVLYMYVNRKYIGEMLRCLRVKSSTAHVL